MNKTAIIACAAILAAGGIYLDSRLRRVEEDMRQRHAAAEHEIRRAELSRLANSRFPESLRIYRGLLRRGVEVFGAERVGPGMCAIKVVADGEVQTFYVPGDWPTGENP